jgi:hypothetical protein
MRTWKLRLFCLGIGSTRGPGRPGKLGQNGCSSLRAFPEPPCVRDHKKSFSSQFLQYSKNSVLSLESSSTFSTANFCRNDWYDCSSRNLCRNPTSQQIRDKSKKAVRKLLQHICWLYFDCSLIYLFAVATLLNHYVE